MLGRAQDELVIALVARALVDAGDEAAIPLARFEQRFFGNFRPGPAELERFADSGAAEIQRLAETDPTAAKEAHRRAETILAELGAASPIAEPSSTVDETDSEPTHDDPESEETIPDTPAVFGEPTLGRKVCDSDTYRAHVRGLRRFPDSSVVAKIIDAAHDAGGVLTAAEVGRIAGRPTSSVDGYASQLQRALNLDGSQVLSKQDDGASIRIDLELLRQQFLGGSS